MRIFYYSTQRCEDLCRKGLQMVESAERENRLCEVFAQNLGNDAVSAQKYKNAPLPVLSLDGTEHFGEAAIRELAKIVGVEYGPSGVSDSGLPPGVDDSMPPGVVADRVDTRAPSTPSYMMPAIPPPKIPQVKPTHVLYTNDDARDIFVPANGSVTVQSYDLIMATFGAKANNYLKLASPSIEAKKRRPLPVLVTMNEAVPTVWYGTAARDYCKLLCALSMGGAMMNS